MMKYLLESPNSDTMAVYDLAADGGFMRIVRIIWSFAKCIESYSFSDHVHSRTIPVSYQRYGGRNHTSDGGGRGTT
jgi:hypothetical protein